MQYFFLVHLYVKAPLLCISARTMYAVFSFQTVYAKLHTERRVYAVFFSGTFVRDFYIYTPALHFRANYKHKFSS